MVKKELVTEVYNKVENVSRIDVERVVEQTIGTICETLQKGDEVVIKKFGTFKPIVQNSRKVRDIGRNKEIIIPERRSVRFKVSDILKNKMNENR